MKSVGYTQLIAKPIVAEELEAVAATKPGEAVTVDAPEEEDTRTDWPHD